MKPIVMFGTIMRAQSFPFTDGSFKYGVQCKHLHVSSGRDATAELNLTAAELPRDCLGHRVRVTVELLDEIYPDFVNAATPSETSR